MGLKACSRTCSEQVLKLNCWSSKLSKLFTPFTNLIKEIENGAQKQNAYKKENFQKKRNDTENFLILRKVL